MKACARSLNYRQSTFGLSMHIAAKRIAVVFTVLATTVDSHAQPVTPIAAIQADPGSWSGQIVTVDGSVTVPINYRGPTLFSGYIQDGSGYGINLFGGSTAPPNSFDLNTTGNLVRVTGEVARFFTTVELVNITDVILLAEDNPATPIRVSTSAANDSRWEGTLIETSGFIVSSEVSGPARVYTLSDGSGFTVARVYNALGVPTFADDTAVVGRGAGTQFQATFQFLPGQASDFVAGTPPADTQPPIVTGAWAPAATEVRVTFNESIDQETGGDEANYSVFETANMSNTLAVETVTVAGPVVTLVLSSGLVTSTGYTVQVSAVEDLIGNSITTPVLRMFPGPMGPLDIVPPTLFAAAATNIRTVTAFFSEPIDTETGSTLSNYYLFETAVPENAPTITSATVAGSTAELWVNLIPGVSYTLRVQTVTDVAGNAILQPQFASFAVPPAVLGIYSDEAGTGQQLCAEPSSTSSFFLLARMPIFAPPGVTGANFRIEVASPAGYVFSYLPPGGAIAIGSPFDLTPLDPNDTAGATVLFSSCQVPTPDPSSLVGFGRIDVYNFSGATTTLRVRMKQPPGSPSMPCPRFFLCDAPFNSPICMAPLTASDIVFETTLNGETCSPPLFTSEVLELDTHESSNDGTAGPLFTQQILGHERTFEIVVDGTLSTTTASTWTSPPGVLCGTPEQAPAFASPGVTNYWVGTDAEIHFAVALPIGGDCQMLESLGYPRHHAQFQVDLGDGFENLEPLGSTPMDPAPGHRYKYYVTGRDAVAGFRWLELPTNDNYGVLRITVNDVNSTDVDPLPRRAPQASAVVVLPNRPDPFNPTTTFQYVLRDPTTVVVSIVDVRGKLVRQLHSGPRAAGLYSATWSGRRDDGSAAASGVYLARVATPLGTAGERLTLIK